MTTGIATQREKEQQLISESGALRGIARGVIVESAADYTIAATYFTEWKAKVKQREAWFKPLKQAQDAAKRVILDREKEAINPLKQAIDIVSQKMMKWKQEEDRKANEERRRLQAIEDRRVEEERLAEAVLLEEEGKPAQADAALAEELPPPRAVYVPPPAPKVAGLNTQKRWDFEVMDQSKIAPEFMMPDLAAIRKTVAGLHEKAAPVVGGIRVFRKESFRS